MVLKGIYSYTTFVHVQINKLHMLVVVRANSQRGEVKKQMVRQTTDSWVQSFISMNPAIQEEALRQLKFALNNESEAIRRNASNFIKGVRVRNSNEDVYSAIKEHLTSFVDVRGIRGYINKPIAIEQGIVPADIPRSSWASIMKTFENRSYVAGFRKHDSKLPTTSGKAGARAALYITDDCDIDALFNERANLYDPKNPKDARRMVEIILESDRIVEPKTDIITLTKQIQHPLFPKWTFNDLSQINTFLEHHLVPALHESGRGSWVSQGKILMRRE